MKALMIAIAFLTASLLVSPALPAQEKAEDAALAIFLAQDTSAVAGHLLKNTIAQLDKLPPEQRDSFLQTFMAAASMQKDGLTVSQPSGNPPVIHISRNGNDQFTISKTDESVNGDDATLNYSVNSAQEHNAVAIHLKLEDGTWRLVNVDVDGKPQLPDLEQPGLLLKEIQRQMTAANEASAVGSIRTINTAAITYAAEFPATGYPPDLKSMGPAPNGDSAPTAQYAALINASLACPNPVCTKNGYVFTYKRIDPQRYCVVARPVTFGTTGRKSFYTDESGVIRLTTEDREPAAQDSPLQ